MIQQIEQVAESSFTILIQGETGTGKELVTRAIHQLSARREKPFVALDCGAIPDTLIESELFGYEKGAFTGADRRKEEHFELAEGGSLSLHEIVNLPRRHSRSSLGCCRGGRSRLLVGNARSRSTSGSCPPPTCRWRGRCRRAGSDRISITV